MKEMEWPEYAALFLAPPPVTEDKSTPGWSTPVKFEPEYRHGDNFQARYALTFDYDHIDEFDLADIRKAYKDFEHVEYTTWTHGTHFKLAEDGELREEFKLRWRFVFPLTRPVSYDEFQAVSRKFADLAGIDLSARESDTPAQLMFLPGVHPERKHEWESHHVEGPWVDPDEVLAQYADWRDKSQWPQRREHDTQSMEGEKIDPRTKPDPIGLFCRTFSIHEAIERFELPFDKVSDAT